MKRMISRSATIICILAVTTQASAEIILLSQSRSVSLGGEPILAPDFGLFEESIEDSWSNWFPPYEGYWLSATQNSEIQTGRFSIHGDTEGGAYEMWDYDFYASAHSDFEVVFEVTIPTPFSLIGSLGPGMYDSNSSLQLDWNGASYLSFSSALNQEIVVSEHGILEPGAYTLTVNALTIAYAPDSGGSSSFNFDFFLETPVAVDQMGWGQVKALYR